MTATVRYLDRCHGCDSAPVSLGVFCARCLFYASDVVNTLSTSASAVSVQPPERPGVIRRTSGRGLTGAADGVVEPTRCLSGKSGQRTSAGPLGASTASTRNENTRRRSASRAASTGA